MIKSITKNFTSLQNWTFYSSSLSFPISCLLLSELYPRMTLQSFHFVDIQEDVETIDRMIADGEATYNKWRHPDPYIGKSHFDLTLLTTGILATLLEQWKTMWNPKEIIFTFRSFLSCKLAEVVVLIFDKMLHFIYPKYTVPWAPGGSKFNRNPVPPSGVICLKLFSVLHKICSKIFTLFYDNMLCSIQFRGSIIYLWSSQVHM